MVAAKFSEGEFRHVLQAARDARTDAERTEALRAELTAAGVPVIDRPGYRDRTVKLLRELVDGEHHELTDAAHASCPGHAAFRARSWDGETVVAIHLCTQWATQGHRDRYAASRQGRAAQVSPEQKADRAQVIAHNKQGVALRRGRAPRIPHHLPGPQDTPERAATYVAAELARGPHALRRALESGSELAASLLTTTSLTAGRAGLTTAAAADRAGDARAQVITLAVVLAAHEAATGTHAWRNPGDDVRRYLGFLAATGYTLSEVEHLAASRPPRRRPAQPASDGDAP